MRSSPYFFAATNDLAEQIYELAEKHGAFGL